MNLYAFVLAAPEQSVLWVSKALVVLVCRAGQKVRCKAATTFTPRDVLPVPIRVVTIGKGTSKPAEDMAGAPSAASFADENLIETSAFLHCCKLQL